MALTSKQLTDLMTFVRASSANGQLLGGALSSFGTNTPAYDWDPATGTPRGIQIFELRTNRWTNPRFEVGTPGIFYPSGPGSQPTGISGLSSSNLGTIQVNYLQTTTENGIPCADFRVFGTSSGSGYVALIPLALSAAPGDVCVSSIYCTLIAGSLTNVGFIELVQQYNSGSQSTTFTPLVQSLMRSRVMVPALGTANVAAIAGTTYSWTALLIHWYAAYAVDLTLRIGAPQVENAGDIYKSASPLILPTPGTRAASTRYNDKLTFGLPADWFPAQGTIMLDYSQDQVYQGNGIVFSWCGSVGWNDSVYIMNQSVNNITGGAGLSFSWPGGVVPPRIKMVLTWGNNQMSLWANGVFRGSIGCVAWPTGTTGSIGCSSWGLDNSINGHVRYVELRSTVMSAADAVSWSGNLS